MARDGSFPACVPDGRILPAREDIVARRSLFARLDGAARVVQVSAPAGSGKTLLVRSWLFEADWADSAAWVTVQGCEQDPGQFWVKVLEALRSTSVGAKLVRPVAGAPGLDGAAMVERLLADLSSLQEPLWLIIDDVHQLSSPQTLAELQTLVMCAPPYVRFVLVARGDMRVGLHRLRLRGELTEIRAADLRFTVDEAQAMLSAAGLALPESALAVLVARTEGWAAGLRLATLSLAGNPDPVRFAAKFSGVERTVAEYLLAEVLDQLPEPARRLLLCTSVCERFNGELADLLSGGSGGEEVLRDLEEAGAFVMALDAGRSWFRCHRLFADLLRRELQRGGPARPAELHASAARWFATHGYPAEAVRHAQDAEDWNLAVRLLTDHFLGLILGGQGATARGLLARFPAAVADRPELVALMAADELVGTSPDEAERHLARAEQEMMSVPADRRGRFQVNLTATRLSLAHWRGDLPAVAEQARRLLAPVMTADAFMAGQCQEARAVALVSLGTAELWGLQMEDAERHLAEGADLARRIGRPWLEINALTGGASVMSVRSFDLAAERFLRAIELAEEHGWAAERVAVPAYASLSAIRIWQMRLKEAEALLERADRAVRGATEPAVAVVLYQARGMLELARGRDAKALAAFQAAERQVGKLVAGHPASAPVRAHMAHVLLRMGEAGQAERILAGQHETDGGQTANAIAALRLAQGTPRAAAAALAPVLAGAATAASPGWITQAHLLEAIARDALGDAGAAERALERALDSAESDGVTFPFIVHPAPRLFLSHAKRRTSHAALLAETLSLLGGGGRALVPAASAYPADPLTESEIRILRYLPTNLPVPEIADKLCVSVHTVRTHTRHLYEKLAVHSRTQAVEQARTLGLLASASHA